MLANYHENMTPQLRVLSDTQIEKVYQATLECLNRTGVEVQNAEARQLLLEAGANVDGQRVRIPAHVVQDAVASNPRSFSLWTRDGKERLQIVPDRVYFGPGPTCTYFIDPDTGERRLTRRGDPGLTAKVCDALDNIDYVMSLGLIDDVCHNLAPVYEFAEMIMNTNKPVLAWAFSPEHVTDIYKIASAVSDKKDALSRRPFIGFFATFHSPLVQTDKDIANILQAAEYGIPVIYIGGSSSGATSPITGAGSLVIYLAGALAGLTILQLKKRGAPMCIGGVPQPMDLRTGRPAYGGPEMSLYSAAMADISRFLGIPFMGTAGASEAKTLDLQAAIESTMQVLLSGLSGATLVHDIGFLDCAEIGSLDMLIMNDEIISMTRRVMRGIEINDDTLMLDLIDSVGPGGEFMSAEETAHRCRSEIWMPTMLNRDSWDNWKAAGAEEMKDRIKSRLKKIMQDHNTLPIPDGAGDKINDILNAAVARECK